MIRNMKIDLRSFKWTREPAAYFVDENKIEITTKPYTDLWQRTYYHFRNDNAPLFQMTTDTKFFSFVVKTDFTRSNHRFDQCGVVVYLDSENSDWSTTQISADIKSMWYRLSRRDDDFCIESSTDGVVFQQMRICHLHEAKDEIQIGIYACSPENSSFQAIFTHMEILECQWLPHDGQKPDDD